MVKMQWKPIFKDLEMGIGHTIGVFHPVAPKGHLCVPVKNKNDGAWRRRVVSG